MTDQSEFARMERSRQLLQEQVAKLSISLRYWQQWEIEYEGMKEELLGLDENCTQQDIQKLEVESEDGLVASQSNFLNRKERKILLYHNGKPRNVDTVIDLLSKRVDYVQQNIKNVSSLLNAAEGKLGALTTSAEPEVRNEDRLPVTEIHEELDEDGNVVSSAVSHPADGAPQIMESLRKAGVENMSNELCTKPSKASDIEDPTPKKVENTPKKPDFSVEGEGTDRIADGQTQKRDGDIHTSDSSSSSSDLRKRRPAKPKKRVSFAEGTKAEPSASDHPQTLTEEEQAALLEEVCSHLRPSLGRNLKKKKIFEQLTAVDTFSKRYPTSMAMSTFLEQETVEPILKQHQYRQARRLLKSNDLSLWEASRVLYIMTAIEVYDLRSPQIVDTIAALKKLQGYAPNVDLVSKVGVAESLTPKDLDAANSKAMAATQSLEDYVSQSAPNKKADEAVHLDEESDSQAVSVVEPVDVENESEVSDQIRSPRIPDDETPEEAHVRRQMLAYNMKEVGAVVAELDLDNDDDLSEGSCSNDEYMELDDDSDDEDEYGRASSRVLTDDYLKEMKALESKLKAGTMVNIGANGSSLISPKSVVSNHSSANESTSETATKKPKAKRAKSVKFAEELDIQESPRPGLTPASQSVPIKEKPIIERIAPAAPETAPSKKPSRFKAARQSQMAPPPSSLADQKPSEANKTTTNPRPINAANIVERPYNPTTKAPEPDDLDPTRINQQVTSEYHRLRNRMIEKVGGFLKPDERTEIPVEEEMEGGKKKVSRFRAARLGRQQHQFEE